MFETASTPSRFDNTIARRSEFVSLVSHSVSSNEAAMTSLVFIHSVKVTQRDTASQHCTYLNKRPF